jgi:outer membrane lipoprotein LolB
LNFLFQKVHAILIIACISFMTGCASIPAPKSATTPAIQQAHQQHLTSLSEIQAFSLKGRIGVQTEGKGFSGSLQWQHTPASDNIALYSPLGGQVASIIKTETAVTLTEADGDSISAKDAESLTQMTLGWQLPLRGLSNWALGRPTNKHIEQLHWDDMGRITRLKQEGWDIEYSDYVAFEGKQLPNKIYLRSPKVNIKLIVENRLDIPQTQQ